ncbi:polysaccharide pyruvyl transferase family protein [Tabrizicola aquatica]|uniref:polysaccharide pyruvyl transferase family protein n=1 Tax=Tabrizicola aquatica TaxID=909926 RepID=UPI000CD2F852|nr:polysaccharide pyruvyl transferase family protein [Tabrizicola aquatica]
MTLFLANDTSDVPHAGCKAVMRSLSAAIAGAGLQITGRHITGTRDVDKVAFAAAEAVLVNGEGTIHHSGPRALFLLQLIQRAKAQGKRVLMVNALFQQYDAPANDILSDLSLLTVREPRSAAFARRFGGQPLTLLDSAADPAFLTKGKARRLETGRVVGGTHRHGLIPDLFDDEPGEKLTLRRHAFEDIVATLRQAEIYLTAQHHGVYAAALAGCPFVTSPSNSHKIESFVEWTGLPIPIVLRQDELEPAIVFALRNRSMYLELADFMRQQSVLTAAHLRDALA